jgi:hypothetical protein
MYANMRASYSSFRERDMTVTTETIPNQFGGMWKFKSHVPRDVVVRQAERLKAAEPEFYQEMYVRAWGGDEEFAICFVATGHQRQYVDRVQAQLRSAYGTYSVYWDISGPITRIL